MRLFKAICTLLLIWNTAIFELSASNTQTPENTPKNTWKEALESKKAVLQVVGFHAPPYFYINSDDQAAGICWEILEHFVVYAKKEYDVEVSLQIHSRNNFAKSLEIIMQGLQDNIIGAGNYSILDERKQWMQFSPAFLPDLGVIISSKNVPIVNSQKDFLENFNALKAVTLQNTTYEKDLQSLKKYYLPDITIEFVDSEEAIINEINRRESYFGYVDLSTYFLSIANKQNIRRQNLFLSHKEGYAFTLPRYSDWEKPIREFMQSDYYRQESEKILSKHLGEEIYSIVRQMVDSKTGDAVILLTKEVEIQQQRLIDSALELERSKNVRNYLLVAVLFAVMVIGFLFNRYKIKQNANLEQARKNEEIRENRAQIKKQNLELERKNLELLELNDEKNQLIQIVAHDLKSPLNQVKGLLNILKLQNKNLTQEDIHLITEAEESAQRMTGMISRILNVNNIEAKEGKIKIEETDITTLIEKQLDHFEPLAKNKNIQLILEPETVGIQWPTDQFFLSQILENLISNAIKFSPFDKSVWIKVANSNDQLLISIKDQGPGFDPGEVEKAFKKYQKLSAKPTGGEESTGLGLSIVKNYTEKLNGSIQITSEKGQGATFILSLPKLKLR